MNEKKFTPGPWKIVEHSWSDTGIYPVADKNNRLCVLSIHAEATEETQYSLEKTIVSNANLIAAAPELLEALELVDEIIYKLPGCPDSDCQSCKEQAEIVSKVKSAIAKAYGETT